MIGNETWILLVEKVTVLKVIFPFIFLLIFFLLCPHETASCLLLLDPDINQEEAGGSLIGSLPVTVALELYFEKMAL